MRSLSFCVVVALTVATLSAGCRPKKPPLLPESKINYSDELPPGQLALRKISPGEYPRFAISQSNATDLIKSIDYSIEYLSRASSKNYFPYLDISHDRAIASLVALKKVVGTPGLTDATLNTTIAQDFEVYQSIGAPKPDRSGYTNSVQFTAYCTPIYDASFTKQGAFQYPLYKRPAELESDPITGDVKGIRQPDGSYAPYYTRKEIEQNGILAGKEIVWLKNRWDAYVITIQGSAKLKMTDGSTYEIGYAGSNGLEYVSPGKQLLTEGKITKEQLTLRGLKAYFEIHPSELDKYLSLNNRYVFFTETHGGPFGSLNVPVTAFATIATDKSVYPRAMPGFLVVPVASAAGSTSAPFSGFMMDQDTGGAIRAAGRTDIYMGVGPAAEERSGRQLFPGALYYIAIKPELVDQYLKELDHEQT